MALVDGGLAAVAVAKGKGKAVLLVTQGSPGSTEQDAVDTITGDLRLVLRIHKSAKETNSVLFQYKDCLS